MSGPGRARPSRGALLRDGGEALSPGPLPLWDTVLIALVAVLVAAAGVERAVPRPRPPTPATADAAQSAAPPAMHVAGEADRAAGNRDYLPLVTVAPVYPAAAQAAGVEGRCTVEYTIAATGAVRGVRARACNPAGVFEHAAVEAARQFKYRPRIEQGVPVAVTGVHNEFVFALEK